MGDAKFMQIIHEIPADQKISNRLLFQFHDMYSTNRGEGSNELRAEKYEKSSPFCTVYKKSK